jgi:hypothetical protein
MEYEDRCMNAGRLNHPLCSRNPWDVPHKAALYGIVFKLIEMIWSMKTDARTLED